MAMQISAKLFGKTASLLDRLYKDRRGNVLMITGLAIIPLTFSVGFAVDYNRAERMQTKLNAIADTAALSAVDPTLIDQPDNVVRQTATDVFNAQVSTLQDVSNVNLIGPTITYQGKVRVVTVGYTATSKNIFGGILHVSTLPINGSATSAASAPPYINFYMLLDSSPSMLLPSSSADLNTIQQETLANVRTIEGGSGNLPGGCAFACHEQKPDNDHIYVLKTVNYYGNGLTTKILLSSDYYNPQKSGYKQYYSIDTGYNSYKVFDGSGSILYGYWHNGNNLYNWNGYISTSPADGYWLTHNYSIVHPNHSTINLRIDDEATAAQALIPFAYNQATTNGVSYGMQVLSFNWTHPTQNNPVTALAPLSSMTTLTNTNYTMFNLPALGNSATAPTLGDGTNQDWWLGNNCPTSSLCNNDKGTDFTNTLNYMYDNVMATPGDGSSAASAQEVMFLITDGMADENYNGSRVSAPLDTNDLNLCSKIKTKGIRIAILYTPYLSSTITGDSWSQWVVGPYLSPSDKVLAALQTCSSTGTNGSPLVYTVAANQNMSDALQALFSLTIQNAHLVK